MSETRKLQQIGGTSLYVSLPKRWTNRMQLKQGDRVALIPQPDGSISIYSIVKQERPREIILEVNAKESRQSLKRAIIAAYVDGFDIIKLKAEERLADEQQDIIREVIENLFGLEVIEVTEKMITIQCLLKPTLPIKKTIQRIHNMMLSMFSETIAALEKREVDLIRGLNRRMRDIKRLSLVTHRLLRSHILFPRLAEQSEISLILCVDCLRVLHRINEVTHNVSKIFESVTALGEQALPNSIVESICETCIIIRDLYDRSIQALLSRDISLANRVLDSEPAFDNLWKLCTKADEESEISSLTLSYVHLLIDNLKQIQKYAAEIAEIAIDRTEAEIKKAH